MCDIHQSNINDKGRGTAVVDRATELFENVCTMKKEQEKYFKGDFDEDGHHLGMQDSQ